MHLLSSQKLVLHLLTLLTLQNAGRGNAKLGTSSLQTSHAKIANYTRDVFNRITLWHNPQNKGKSSIFYILVNFSKEKFGIAQIMLYLCIKINNNDERNKVHNKLPGNDSPCIADERLRDGARCGVGIG